MEIREFSTWDKDGVLSCLKEVWSIDSIEEKTLLDFIGNDNHLYVVEEDGEILGCATLHIQKKLIRNGGLAAFVEEVVVKGEHRGKGIGEKLIDKIVEVAKEMGCYKVTLSCFPERVAFYERCGFIKENHTMRFNP
jgi:glucosamine-phosphate N-acetyltransferase